MKTWVKNIFEKIVSIDDTPEKIAKGFANGVFWGVFPTFFLGIPIAIGCAAIFKFNKLSSIIGSMIMNPWTTPMFWGISYFLGKLILGDYYNNNLNWQELVSFKNFFANLKSGILWPFLVGNIVLSISLAFLFYFLVFKIVTTYQKKHKTKEKI